MSLFGHTQTVISDDEAKLGQFRDPVPLWLGRVLAWFLNLIGPKGLEFAKYSLSLIHISEPTRQP